MRSVSRRQFLAGSGVALAGLGLAGLGLTGCGSSSSTASTSAASTAATSGDLTKIDFVLDYTPNTNHTGIYVAIDKGYYADEGLEVNVEQPPEDGADALLGAGNAQMGITCQDTMANYLGSDQPLPVTAVAAIIQHNTSGIMSRAADGITHPAAMMDHTYATWELDIEQATIKDVVEKDGGDYSRVNLVPYNTSDDVAGLVANQYDCVWVFEGWACQNAKVQDVAYNYFAFKDIDPALDFYTPCIAANSDFLSENPDAVKAFLRATKKGYEYAIDNPDDAAGILVSAVPELDSALVKASQEYLAGEYAKDASSWGVIDSSRWDAYFEWLNDQSLVSTPITAGAGFSMDYLA
jgi:ABC-type nitrate/sulfonate/bicarbonate transport system substrate-binding protein